MPDSDEQQLRLQTPEPRIDDGRRHSLDRRWINGVRIAGSITATILCGGLFLAMLIVGITTGLRGPIWLLMALGWLVFAALIWTLVLFGPVVRYRHITYQVASDEICIRRGVLWRSIHTVPRSRVQHTDVSQGPIERMYELATLIIYTAGTQHAAIALSGLPHDRASRIRDHLIEGGTGDAV